MGVIEIDGIYKRYRPLAGYGSGSLKSFLLHDLWGRKPPTAGPSNDAPWALQNVSLHLASGQTVGIIGSNGSGKSTLLKLLARILRPDRGSIRIEGSLAALIELGAGFHPELSGRENILIGGIILGLTKQQVRTRIDSIIAYADIGAFIDYPVRTYSSGMQARLGFALAVHVDPDILLIDEILAVGDADFSSKCRATLDGFKAKGKTMVLVSHQLDVVETWCDAAVWLHRGQVRAQGPASDVVAAYRASVQPGVAPQVA